MRCPRCNTENPMGLVYCAGCGAKLELTEADAHVQAVAAVRHENWQKAFVAMNRTVFLFVLAFVLSLLFRGCATRDIMAHFSAGAPLPPPPPLALSAAFVEEPQLPVPAVTTAAPIKAEKSSEADILADLALTARDRLNCSIHLKRGGVFRGILLLRTKDQVRIIIDWGPPISVRTVKTGEIDLARSEFPE